MSWETVLTLSIACIIAMATPGPGVFAVISRALALGFKRNLPFIIGMVCGDLTLVAIAVSGLATLAATMGEFFAVLKFLAAGYLVYIGYKALRSKAQTLDDMAVSDKGAWRAMSTGWLLTASNPKAILFYMAFLPVFVDIPTLGLTGILEVCAIVTVCLSSVMVGYAVLSSSVRTLFRKPKAVRMLNRFTGTAMIGTAVAIASR
ncbi:LysE family translocator [Kiloniella sp. b19]|uniref:LysE family translocator n=1 Tax=Kiloniella sp. GXU_MW_B19 TaxID=3141326 RepID=UPI0031D3C180